MIFASAPLSTSRKLSILRWFRSFDVQKRGFINKAEVSLLLLSLGEDAGFLEAAIAANDICSSENNCYSLDEVMKIVEYCCKSRNACQDEIKNRLLTCGSASTLPLQALLLDVLCLLRPSDMRKKLVKCGRPVVGNDLNLVKRIDFIQKEDLEADNDVTSLHLKEIFALYCSFRDCLQPTTMTKDELMLFVKEMNLEQIYLSCCQDNDVSCYRFQDFVRVVKRMVTKNGEKSVPPVCNNNCCSSEILLDVIKKSMKYKKHAIWEIVSDSQAFALLKQCEWPLKRLFLHYCDSDNHKLVQSLLSNGWDPQIHGNCQMSISMFIEMCKNFGLCPIISSMTIANMLIRVVKKEHPVVLATAFIRFHDFIVALTQIASLLFPTNINNKSLLQNDVRTKTYNFFHYFAQVTSRFNSTDNEKEEYHAAAALWNKIPDTLPKISPFKPLTLGQLEAIAAAAQNYPDGGIKAEWQPIFTHEDTVDRDSNTPSGKKKELIMSLNIVSCTGRSKQPQQRSNAYSNAFNCIDQMIPKKPLSARKPWQPVYGINPPSITAALASVGTGGHAMKRPKTARIIRETSAAAIILASFSQPARPHTAR